MKGYRINPDIDFVLKIIEGTERKNGHCPCKLSQDESNLCPCDDFIKEKNCKCKLLVPIESEKNNLIKN